MKPKKQKFKLKDQIKNFFNYDIKKDLQEEECTKKFEKVNLFTLTKNKLFLGILLFLLIINIFVGFNINHFYIRAILSFIFLITIPGLLIMLMMKIREVRFWEYLVYVVGLSVSFIMFGGLAVNWILPWLNITDKPLSLYPIFICFNIFLIVFWLIAYIKNKDFKPLKIQYPKLDLLNRIMFIIPMFFPILAILGAFILNNYGTNILTMIMLGGIAVYVFMIIIFRKKLNPNVYLWAILMISLALLFSFSMRSWFVNGGDVNKEYFIFQLTKQNAFWNISNFENAYNAMLSISIFPTVLSFFMKINTHFMFKLFYPLTFVFVPAIIYLILERHFKKIFCFLASFFFMSQSVYFGWTELPIRQEIAFIFFSLMILVLFTKQINLTLKKALFVIFGVSMIVSHYSTSYLALAIFTLAYLFTLIYRVYENQKIKKGKIHLSQKSEFYLTGALILLLLVFGFLWYSQITPTSDGLIDFVHKSFSNLGDMFNEEVQAYGRTPFDQFNLFFTPIDKNQQLKSYINETNSKYSIDPSKDISYNYEPKIMNSKILPLKISYDSYNKIYFNFEILKKLMKLFIILGFFLILINYKKLGIDHNYIFILIACFFLFGILIFLPFISMRYSLLRVYQHFLIILSFMAVLGSLFMFKFIKRKNIRMILSSILFIIFFVFMSGFIPQLIGGTDGSMRLNNNLGVEYDVYFTHNAELISIDWIFTNYKSRVYLDLFANTKLFLSSNKNYLHSRTIDVLPQIIEKDSYVYLDYSNVFNKIVFNRYEGGVLFYNFPIEFLNENKNKIYNNGGSEIFK